ncbi:MAG: PilZ domain-containing protein [Oscillospiraceae bacterium]|nr:PilZ domain-containing protein [Oscillospiraceae bacterium]
MEQNLYLLLDSKGMALAQARPQGPASLNGNLWQLVVLDDQIDLVLEHKKFKLMAITDASPSYEGTLVRSRNDMIQLEVRKSATSGNDMRKNLRVPVQVKSFLYPVTGYWAGRREVHTNDLSCGGVAFHTDHSLQIGEVFEIVIPVTSAPLVVKGEILRMRPSNEGYTLLYASKFVDLCNDEETLLREAVFNLQLSGRPRAGR